MSFDIFLICVRNGEEATFKRELYEEIMSRGAIDPRYPLDDVTYADGGASCISGIEKPDIESIGFNRPGGETFYSRLWELADRTGSFIIWPDNGRSIAVTRADTIPHIFEGMAADFGPPFIVRSGSELEDAVEYLIDPNEPPVEPGEFDIELDEILSKRDETEHSGFESRRPEDAAPGATGTASRSDPEAQSESFRWYGIFAYWDVRQESPEQITERLTDCLDRLCQIHPLYAEWWLYNRTPHKRKPDPEREFLPYALVRGKVLEIIKRNNWRDRTDVWSSLGHKILAQTALDWSPNILQLDICAGGSADSGPGFRAARMWTNFLGPANPELFTFANFRASLEIIATSWDADFGAAMTTGLERYGLAPFGPCWMTYLAPKWAIKIAPPSGIRVDHISNGGLIMCATEAPFDRGSSKHMDAAFQIRDSLTPIMIESEKIWAKPVLGQSSTDQQ